MGIISAYLLAEIAYKIFKTKLSFILVGFIYSLCFSASSYEIEIGSDSLAISVSVIGFYFLINFIEDKNPSHIVFSGLLIAWAIFLRPIMGILWGVIAIYFVISAMKSNFRKLILPFIFFIIPFVLFESVWIVRNYIKHHEFDPLDSKHLYISNMKDTKNVFLYPFLYTFR